MGSATSALGVPEQAAAVGPKDALRTKHAHATVAMAVATLAMAAASAIQAVLYLNSFGIGARTDGFFVVFGLYATFGVFSQSIRVTSAPLLVGDDTRMTTRELGATLVLIAIPVAIATIVLRGPLAHVLAPSLASEGRSVARSALPLLGCAMVLQLWAAGGATVLAVRDRFDRVASAYILGAVGGLVVYVAVSGPAGELSLGWSMLAMAVVTGAVMLHGVHGSRPSGERAPLSLRRLPACASLVLGRTFVYLAFNALYVITVAFTTGYDAGDATVLSYAYLFASYLVAGTGFALGMSRIADMRRGALADWREVIADTVPAGFRYAMLFVAPALAALVAGGATLMGDLFPHSLDGSQVHQLRVFAALLAAWTVGALLVNLLLPAMFALGRAKLTAVLAAPLLALHVAATAAGGALFGADGAVGAFFVAPLCFAVVLLATGAGREAPGLARELAADGGRFVASAAVSYGAGAVAGAAVTGAAGALVTVALGSALYAAFVLRLAPTQMRLLVGSLRARTA
jgi:hypothetical protein